MLSLVLLVKFSSEQASMEVDALFKEQMVEMEGETKKFLGTFLLWGVEVRCGGVMRWG